MQFKPTHEPAPDWSALIASLPSQPAANEPTQSTWDVRPFIHDGDRGKALHFSLCEIQSRMKPDDPDALDLEYTRTMMGVLLFIARPNDIAMIGLGGGSLAKFCYRYLPQSHIQVVEINPHVIALRDTFLVPADDARLTVVHGDGADFVRCHPGRFEVLFVDGFDSAGFPERLYSQRFYDDCHVTLRPGGIMVANLHLGHRHYGIQLERIHRSFDSVVLVVEDKDKNNSIVFACNGPPFSHLRPGAMRWPPNLEDAATDQLLTAFARVSSALKRQGGFKPIVRRY